MKARKINEAFETKDKTQKVKDLLGFNHLLVTCDDEGAADFKVFRDKNHALSKYEALKEEGMERYADNWGAIFEIVGEEYQINIDYGINWNGSIELIDRWERTG